MSLDVFSQDRTAALDYAMARSAPDLPAGFSDVFTADWNVGLYFGQSIAAQNSRMSVLSDIGEQLYQRTRDQSFLKAGLTEEGLPDPTFHVGLLNARIAEHRKVDPSFAFPDVTEDQVQDLMVQKSTGARRAAREMAAREKTWGGTFGGIMGSLSSQATDPINIVAAPLAAPESLGILATALIWGGIAGGTQAANEFIAGGYREQVQPGYGTSPEPARNILQAAVGGAAIGGGVKGLAELWRVYKPLTWARSVRDAGNVIESEAQIQRTNPFPDAAGEVAHRDAMSTSIDDIAAGRAVSVDHIITPEQAAHIETLADDATASYWETRLAEASAEERAAMGATDTPLAPELPEQAVKVMREDPALPDAIAHDFEHLKAEHGDKLIPMGEMIDADGNRVPLMRSIKDILTEADRRETAANELFACLMPEAA